MTQYGKRLIAVIIMMFIGSCGGEGGPTAGYSTPVSTAGAGGHLDGTSLDNIEEVDLTSAATLSISGIASDRYLLAVTATSPSSTGASVRLTQGSLAALGLEDPTVSSLEMEESYGTAEEAFHQYLREMETVMRDSGDFDTVASPTVAALTTPPATGSVQSFRVLSSMNSITTYQEVSAELRVATDSLLIYVDEVNDDNISDTDLESLAANFEEVALPRERELFGRESDLNFDGRITILMSCVVNRMATSGGIVTGFFFPGDMYQRSSVNPVSNAQEIFYTLVPDPSGACGTPISASFAVGNILPGVLAHEYQHMVSFNQHVFMNRGTTEEPWLNECLSHLAEDLTGFGNENPSRVRLFLAQPSMTPVIPVTSPTLAERGACYLFLRYLYEQSNDGDLFIRNLLETTLTGVENLEAAFDGPDSDFDEFPEFMNRWSIALSLSEAGVTSDTLYNYQARSRHPTTGNFTGICVRCDTQDGRGTVLGGPVMTTVANFPSISLVKGTQIFDLGSPSGNVSVAGSGGVPLKGSLIQLSIN